MPNIEVYWKEAMNYRTPADVKEEFSAHPRRALIVTTLDCESQAVSAHLTNPELMIGKSSVLYEYGLFSEPAGEWLVVHAITPAGNSDAGLVVTEAHHDFGRFLAVIFVGVAGSLKEDIPIGSIVIGDGICNSHAAKVEDERTLARPETLPAALELLTVARALIHRRQWTDLIRPPADMSLPDRSVYPCNFPPLAVIKGIVSGEEVVAGAQSARFSWLHAHFNNCGAVEMEGWGFMNAARRQNSPAIVVRGISDMCAGKNPCNDVLHQPIAAMHAAAFAFSILSFLSKAPATAGIAARDELRKEAAAPAAERTPLKDRRIAVVFNFEGSKAEWPDEKVNAVVDRLKQAIGDEELMLVRIESGSIRLVMRVRKSDLEGMDLAKLRTAISDAKVTLLGVTPLEMVADAEEASAALAASSVDLLAWERTLPDGQWIERPEWEQIEARFRLQTSSTVLLGEPGSGKSALLSKMAAHLLTQSASVFAIKADFLSAEIRTETDLQRDLQLPALPSDLILRLAALQPVYVIIDQLDALASQLDLKSARLNVLLNLVRRIGGTPNVHVLLSSRTFEFNHDVRLRAIGAEAVQLALPPWHDVKAMLAEVGVNPDAWPEKAREVVRIPQALKIFIVLVRAGRLESFSTYQAMLEQLWRDRISSADDSERLIALASDVAEQMAEDEALWLAVSRFDDRLHELKRLEGLGFIVRSDNNLSIAFSHQTIFEYVLARTFVRNTGLLSKYVLERQDSLFIRAKLWWALNYLREAEVSSYEREFLEIWDTATLRRHLRLLLIEFLGQVSSPLDFEKTCMTEVLHSQDLRIFGLKAICNGSGWFAHFASTAIRDAMVGSDPEANQASRILALNWTTDSELVAQLIGDRWLPDPGRDTFSWAVLSECPQWDETIEEMAVTVLERSPVAIWHVTNMFMSKAIEQPDVAIRLVRAKLDFLFAEAKKRLESSPVPVGRNDEGPIASYIRLDRSRAYRDLLEATDWADLPTLAEAEPIAFLQGLWPWYVTVFSEMLSLSDGEDEEHLYPGQYRLDIVPSEKQSESPDEPLKAVLWIAVEGLAKESPEEFLKWANENEKIEILAVQQLLAHGYKVAADRFASVALEWLLLDKRRFQLGTAYGLRCTTIELIEACASHWSGEEIERFEGAVHSYAPNVPKRVKEPEHRRVFLRMVRATKKDLLQAMGIERLSMASRELVRTEQRALGNRFDRSISKPQGGVIGSPMDATAIAKAKDRDILKIFQEIPDNTDWDHPTHWMRGGNIQLSRAFAEFARTDSKRAINLMGSFQPDQQERAAGYALDSMAEDAANDSYVIKAFVDCYARGFQADEFRCSAARAIEKIASRKTEIGDEVIDMLVQWLSCTRTPAEEPVEQDGIERASTAEDAETRRGSILWGFGHTAFLPNGNFNILVALARILLNRKEAGRDRYLKILDDHLLREYDQNTWKALLMELSNAGGATPQIVSTFIRKLFLRFPEIADSREAVFFFAHAQRWDDELVFGLIKNWRQSDRGFLQQAYGELVGLIATVKQNDDWRRALDEILSSGTDDMKVGLAYAAVNTWSDERLRLSATETLVALLDGANKDVVAAVMDFFRVNDELTPDPSTVELLRALSDPKTDLSVAPSHFIVERLQALLPNEAGLIAAIAGKLVTAWRSELGSIQTGTSMVAPQLTDLALTLHRLGGRSRQSGIALFEAMIEMDAYGAKEALSEIDGRFDPQQGGGWQRHVRRRRLRSQSRGAS